jgi:hypothetical protein
MPLRTGPLTVEMTMHKKTQSNPSDDRFVNDVEWWEEHFSSLEAAYEAERKVRMDGTDLDYQPTPSRKPKRRRD